MTLLGWTFWGFLLFLMILAVFLQIKGQKVPPEKSDNHLWADKQAQEDARSNQNNGSFY